MPVALAVLGGLGWLAYVVIYQAVNLPSRMLLLH